MGSKHIKAQVTSLHPYFLSNACSMSTWGQQSCHRSTPASRTHLPQQIVSWVIPWCSRAHPRSCPAHISKLASGAADDVPVISSFNTMPDVSFLGVDFELARSIDCCLKRFWWHFGLSNAANRCITVHQIWIKCASTLHQKVHNQYINTAFAHLLSTILLQSYIKHISNLAA